MSTANKHNYCECGNLKDIMSNNCRKCASKIRWYKYNYVEKLGSLEIIKKRVKTVKCNKSLAGKNNPMYGKKRPDTSLRNKLNPLKGKESGNYKHGKYCQEISKQALKCRSCASKSIWKKYRDKILKGMANKWDNKEFVEKFKQVRKKLWSNKDFKEIMLHKMLSGSVPFRKNKLEILLEYFINQILPNEYKYTGDGKSFIAGFVPDFINVNGQKKIIELFGDYWHTKLEAIKRDKFRLKSYKKYGYNTLIIWEHELNRNPEKVISRIMEFDLK